MKTREEIKKLCGWSLHENPEPGNPRNLDFFEADVQKVMQLLNAERTQPAPEVREALEFLMNHDWREVYMGQRYLRLQVNVEEKTKEWLMSALSLPGLEAVECYTCFLIRTGLLDHLDPCPQRCDKGRVWVRKS